VKKIFSPKIFTIFLLGENAELPLKIERGVALFFLKTANKAFPMLKFFYFFVKKFLLSFFFFVKSINRNSDGAALNALPRAGLKSKHFF